MKPVEAVNRSKYFKNDLMKFILNCLIIFIFKSKYLFYFYITFAR